MNQSSEGTGPVGRPEPQAGKAAPTTPRQDAMVALLRAAGIVQRGLEAVCAAHGVTHDQYNVLRILRGARPGGLPRYAIADRLISRAPDVTRLLGRLERGGLVERSRAAEDQRLSIARITDRGLELLLALDPQIRGVHERLGAGLDDERSALLAELCRTVGSAAEPDA